MDSSVTLAEDLGDKDRLECNTLEKERKQLKYKQRERDRKGSNKFWIISIFCCFCLNEQPAFL